MACCHPARFFTAARYSISSRPYKSSFRNPMRPLSRTRTSIASFSMSMKCGSHQSSTFTISPPSTPARYASQRLIGLTRLSAGLRPTHAASARAPSGSSFAIATSSLLGRQSFDVDASRHSWTTFPSHPSSLCSGSRISASSI